MSSKIIFSLVFLFFLAIGAGSYYYNHRPNQVKGAPLLTTVSSTPGSATSTSTSAKTQNKGVALQEQKNQQTVDRFQLLLQQAFEAKSKGDAGDKAGYEKAVKLYTAAVNIAPTAWIALYNLADVYVLMGDYDHAEEYYQRALGSEKHQDVIWMGYLGFHQNYLKESPDTLYPRYLAAVKDSSGSVAITLMFAQFLVEHQRGSEALPYFQLLAKNFPKDQYYAEQVKKLQTKKEEK